MAEKQRVREAEAEARRATQKTQPSANRSIEKSTSSAATPEVSGRPKINLAAPSGGGWREREAAKGAGEASQGSAPRPSAPAPASAPAPVASPAAQPVAASQPDVAGKGPSGYLPPHLRGKTGADGAGAPRSESSGEGDRWRTSSRPAAAGREDSTGGSRYTAAPRAGMGSRTDSFNADRTASPANGAPPKEMTRTFSSSGPAAPASADKTDSQAAGGQGKYVPRFKRGQ